MKSNINKIKEKKTSRNTKKLKETKQTRRREENTKETKQTRKEENGSGCRAGGYHVKENDL